MSQPQSPASLRPDQIISQLLSGKSISQSITVAAELDIAELLKDGPRAADDLAAASETHADGLYRILRVLTSVGVFEELPGRRFQNNALSETLRAGSANSVRASARWLGVEAEWRAWGELIYSVRTGKPAFDKAFGVPVFDYLKKDERTSTIFNEAMTGMTAIVGQGVVRAYDFSGIKTLVDVGGGQGLLLTQVLGKHPEIHGVVYDLPEVVATASETLRASGHEGRIEAVGGSFFERVPPGADAYMMKHILHDWDDAHCERILSNCRAAMAEGGRVLVIEHVITDGPDASTGKILDLEMLVMTTGRERTQEEFEALFKRVGLKLVSVTPTDTDVSVLEAHPA